MKTERAARDRRGIGSEGALEVKRGAMGRRWKIRFKISKMSNIPNW